MPGSADRKIIHDTRLLVSAMAAVGIEQTKAWPLELSETLPNGKTRLEWLRDSPASRKTRGLAAHIAKIDFLKKLWADRLHLGLAAGMLKAQARSMLYRKPARLKRMRGERKTLEIACFLRLQLMRLTDGGLGMIDYRIADLWRQARTRADLTVCHTDPTRGARTFCQRALDEFSCCLIVRKRDR